MPKDTGLQHCLQSLHGCVLCFFFFNRVAISMIEVIWSCFQFSAVVQKGGAAAP